MTKNVVLPLAGALVFVLCHTVENGKRAIEKKQKTGERESRLETLAKVKRATYRRLRSFARNIQ
jgi:hypothetical protein